MYEVEITVSSNGRGEQVASDIVEVTVPDMGDLDVLTAAKDALDQLASLPSGEGPDPDTADQPVDMLREGVRPDPRPALQDALEQLEAADDGRTLARAIADLEMALTERNVAR